MTRLPYWREEDLDAARREVWDLITATRRPGLVNDEGGLSGPYNSWIAAPGVGRRLADLGATVRFETTIERRLSEVAIITTGARWKAEYEWWAHSRMALEHGVPAAVVDAIGDGQPPPFETDDERVVYSVAAQLAADGRVDDDTYRRAQELLGDSGMVELVSLCGYYTLISFMLNAFDVPLPAGVAPRWPG
jgi:4-carboxymuconolactone decarboxylase